MNYLISVIIPIYNAEQTLRNSLESLLNQKYQNFEAICINDGSTDKSVNILEEFHQKDKRFSIFSIENAGVSNARNVGINHANGDFIFFFDADDILNANCLHSLIKPFKNSFSPTTITVTDNHRVSCLNDINVIQQRDAKKEQLILDSFKEQLLSGQVVPTVWGKLIPKQLLVNNSFSPELSHGEDFYFLVKMFTTNEITVIHCSESKYFYLETSESATATISTRSLKSNTQKYSFIFSLNLTAAEKRSLLTKLYDEWWNLSKSLLRCRSFNFANKIKTNKSVSVFFRTIINDHYPQNYHYPLSKYKILISLLNAVPRLFTILLILFYTFYKPQKIFKG